MALLASVGLHSQRVAVRSLTRDRNSGKPAVVSSGTTLMPKPETNTGSQDRDATARIGFIHKARGPSKSMMTSAKNTGSISAKCLRLGRKLSLAKPSRRFRVLRRAEIGRQILTGIAAGRLRDVL